MAERLVNCPADVDVLGNRLVGIVSLGDLAAKTGDDRLCGEALEQVSEPAMPVR